MLVSNDHLSDFCNVKLDTFLQYQGRLGHLMNNFGNFSDHWVESKVVHFTAAFHAYLGWVRLSKG